MKYKHVLVFVLALFIISFITGIIYGIYNPFDLITYFTELANHNNMFLKDFILIIILLISSMTIIGVFINTILIGLYSVSIGYVLTLFIVNYKIKGILLFFIYFITNKFLILLILFYLFYINYKYNIRLIKNILGNERDYMKNIINPFLKKYFIIYIFLILYDIFLFFFSNSIIKYFINML